jgi:hypothetical protein
MYNINTVQAEEPMTVQVACVEDLVQSVVGVANLNLVLLKITTVDE